MRYHYFLLDADETVFDFIASSKESLRYALAQFSLPYSDEIYSLFKKHNDAVWREYELGALTKAQLRVKRFECFFAEQGVIADAASVDKIYFGKLCTTGYLLDGADAFLSGLKERGEIYMITNGTTAAQEGRIGASGIGKYLDGVFISDELGVAKPHREFFDQVFSAVRKDKKRCVVIGDSLSSDILGANNAGVDSIWYNPKGQKEESFARPTFTAGGYEDILRIIDKS